MPHREEDTEVLNFCVSFLMRPEKMSDLMFVRCTNFQEKIGRDKMI